ncbi:MAG: DUF2892 domain-containing protein [Sulfitobacter sp.]
MSVNVGKIDQVVRLLVGFALVLVPFLSRFPVFDNMYVVYVAVVIGAVLILTAVSRVCPLYSILGIKTSKV